MNVKICLKMLRYFQSIAFPSKNLNKFARKGIETKKTVDHFRKVMEIVAKRKEEICQTATNKSKVLLSII